jgi:nucleoside-diphosphate-sugar epimerase
MTINELIASLERNIGNRAAIVNHPRHPADMLTSQADVSKAKSLLDWEPQVTLEEGIEKLVQWYQQERSWAKDIKTE